MGINKFLFNCIEKIGAGFGKTTGKVLCYTPNGHTIGCQLIMKETKLEKIVSKASKAIEQLDVLPEGVPGSNIFQVANTVVNNPMKGIFTDGFKKGVAKTGPDLGGLYNRVQRTGYNSINTSLFRL